MYPLSQVAAARAFDTVVACSNTEILEIVCCTHMRVPHSLVVFYKS